MPLSRVRIQTFRCLTEVELALHPERNYIFGPNGAGKTSVLETIYLLGRGRSFRTRQNRRLIQRGSSGFSVYAELDDDGASRRLGVGLGPNGLELRLDGATAPGIAALARLLPVHVIEPNLHQLIEGGPRQRRRFLEWGVFHVEQGYLKAWRGYRRVLGQRNAALKAGQGEENWNEGLLEAGQAVDQFRSGYVAELSAALEGLGEALLGYPLEVTYRSGWRSGLSFAEALRASTKRDRTVLATQVGPHRADLFISLGARGVRDEVSRGQQKLVAAGLVLAQIRVFAAGRGSGGVLLVDDPGAELDAAALEALISVLDEIPAQRVMTGISEASLAPESGYPVFHVEQGRVLPVL